ncbi:tautomerase family protein [Curtobacterium sp. PhB130]|uniref:tautomerase family protein n=1 Tax=Curtobacterium sp. PhB130 TaxID=2485178 RepID=UPI001C8590FD|nr:tautomerase family protein [Curtobacterium sp. PhB130]
MGPHPSASGRVGDRQGPCALGPQPTGRRTGPGSPRHHGIGCADFGRDVRGGPAPSLPVERLADDRRKFREPPSVLCRHGPSDATKRSLVRELFARIESEAGISSHSVEITITETPKVNWGIRGMNAEDLVLAYEIDVEPPLDQTGLVELIRARQRDLGHPLVVGISGYCGSGKSTLARTLAAELAGAVRIRGDDFLDPVRSHRRSTDWDGVDRRRLLDSVLAPHRAAQPGVFHRFDWTTRSLGPAEPLPSADILVVDLIGLFHPDTLPSLDVTVWCDVELDVAAQRGMARDARLGRRHESLWRDVWVPNERDFEQRFAPQRSAMARYRPAS